MKDQTNIKEVSGRFRLSAKQKERLERLADKWKCSEAEVIRRLLERENA